MFGVKHRSWCGWPWLGDEGSVSEIQGLLKLSTNFVLVVLPISRNKQIDFFSGLTCFMRASAKLRCCSIYPFSSTSCHVKTASTRDSQQQRRKKISLPATVRASKSVTQQILKASTALCCNWCTRRLPGKHLAPRPLNCETPVGTRVAMRCSHAPSQRISPLCRCTSYSWIVMCD